MARKGTGNKEDSEQTDSVNSENASPNGLKTKLSPGNCFLHDYFHFDLTVQSLTMHLQNINHLCSYFALLILMYAPYKSCRNNDVSNSETTKKQKSLGSTNQAVTDTAQQSSMRDPHSVPGCRAQRAPLTSVTGSLTPSS